MKYVFCRITGITFYLNPFFMEIKQGEFYTELFPSSRLCRNVHQHEEFPCTIVLQWLWTSMSETVK